MGYETPIQNRNITNQSERLKLAAVLIGLSQKGVYVPIRQFASQYLYR
jgi:hypothetical protein